jgi:hypothetical protein
MLKVVLLDEVAEMNNSSKFTNKKNRVDTVSNILDPLEQGT